MEEILAELNRINPWWNDKHWESGYKTRSFYEDIMAKVNNTGLITMMLGMRRCGKTSLQMMRIEKLIDEGINPKQIMYITFDQRIFTGQRIVELMDMVWDDETKKDSYLFLDEVQEKEGWQEEVKYIYDLKLANIVLNGSSSLLLSKKTSLLTGRFAKIVVMPLSFAEFLEFTNKKISNTNLNQNRLLVEKYLNVGGLPDVVLGKIGRNEMKTNIEGVMYRDIVSLYGLRNPKILMDLYELLADCTTTPVGSVGLEKTLGLASETANMYLQYLQDAYILWALPFWSRSRKMTKKTIPKYYLSDTGVLKMMSLSARIGHLAETAVVLQTLRYFTNGYLNRIGYVREASQEIDLIIDDKKYEIKTSDEIKIESNPTPRLGNRVPPLDRARQRNSLINNDTKYIVLRNTDNNRQKIELWEFLLMEP